MPVELALADLERALRARLERPLEAHGAHVVFAPRRSGTNLNERIAPPDARQAAALIAIYPGSASGDVMAVDPASTTLKARTTAGVPTIALTVRRNDLPNHPGQISLPGGRIDAGETAEAAALREAHEEANINPAAVRVLGRLSPLYVPVSRFVITPIVGMIDTRPAFHPSAHEVAEIIEVSVPRLLHRATLQWGTRTPEGYLVEFPYFNLTEPPRHVVWGATAMILGEFTRLLEPAHGDDMHERWLREHHA